MSDLFSITDLDTDKFFAELDRDYYKAFPEQWNNEEDFFIQHPDYTAIIEGQGNSHKRRRQAGEKVTSRFIKRDGYHLWEVIRSYIVNHHDSKMREVSLSNQTELVNVDKKSSQVSETHQVGISQAGIIGKLRLIDIKVGRWRLFGGPIDDELVFKKVE